MKMMNKTDSIKQNQNDYGYIFAISSGICAAGASLFGKLLGNVENYDMTLRYILYPILIGIMILFNTMVWSFYIKALHSNGGTLKATVVSSASNYLISDILGQIVFGEVFNTMSLLGTIFIIIGVVILTKEQHNKNE